MESEVSSEIVQFRDCKRGAVTDVGCNGDIEKQLQTSKWCPRQIGTEVGTDFAQMRDRNEGDG